MTTALDVLRQRLPQARPRIAIVLGSGWGDVAQRVQDATRISYRDLPGFPLPSVQGHASDLIHGRLGEHEVVVLTGRKHTYETGEPDGMKLPIRTLRDWGCEVLVQTNAAGSLQAAMPPGSLMALSDHINFSQRSPLIGESGSERFVSMVNAYDEGLREQALAVAAALLVAGAIATTVGLVLPWLLARLGSDPAYGSGPLATIIQDLLSLLTYFLVVTALVI